MAIAAIFGVGQSDASDKTEMIVGKEQTSMDPRQYRRREQTLACLVFPCETRLGGIGFRMYRSIVPGFCRDLCVDDDWLDTRSVFGWQCGFCV